MTREQALSKEPEAQSFDPAWYAEWRELVGGDLMGGYARLCYIPEHTRIALAQEDE